MVRRSLALALAVVAAAGCLRGRGTADEPLVTAVKLDGVKAFDPKAIEAKLATQPPTSGEGPLGFLTKVGFRLDPDALAADGRRVEAWYRANGYYDARVQDVRVVPDGPGRAKVVMQIDEGTPVHVRSISLVGLDAAPEARARLDRLPLREGDVFSEAAYDATRSAIDAALKTTGYATGEVVQSARVLPAEHAAEVSYDVRPGARYRFGPIFIAGSSAVSRERIREQAAVEIHPGEFYDETRLARAQARVFDLGVFAGVRVTRGTPSPERGVIPIVVAVREAPFRTLRAGPGVAIEATRWEARGTAGWTHRNLLGNLQRVDADLRVGYAWLPTLLTRTKEGLVGQLGLGYSQPAALGRSVDLSTRVEIERGLETGYDFWAQRGKFALPLRIAPRWSLIPSYNLEVYELSNTPTESLATTPNTAGVVERPLLENCTRAICLLSYLEQRIAWDGRDDPVNTRRGLYVSLSVQEGTNLGAYGYRFIRLLPEVRGFVPFGSRLVLASRARLGALIPVNEAGEPPIVARFYAGGPLSMRGYYTRRLSPMVPEDNVWVPVGGNGLADGSLELRYSLGGGWGSALFLDAGNVSVPSGRPSQYLDALKPRDLQLASGVGLRYGTPFGPIRLDIGVRLPTSLGSGVSFADRFPTVPQYRICPPNPTPGTLCYPLHREPILAIHFSIGEAF